jgi:hypothetical protein
MTKRHYKWLALGLVLMLIAFSVVRALSARKAQQEALAQAAWPRCRPWWSSRPAT